MFHSHRYLDGIESISDIDENLSPYWDSKEKIDGKFIDYQSYLSLLPKKKKKEK